MLKINPHVLRRTIDRLEDKLDILDEESNEYALIEEEVNLLKTIFNTETMIQTHKNTKRRKTNELQI